MYNINAKEGHISAQNMNENINTALLVCTHQRVGSG